MGKHSYNMQKIILYLILINQILFAQDFANISFAHQIKKSLYDFSDTILIWPFKNIDPDLEYWKEIIQYNKYLNGTENDIKIPINKQRHYLFDGNAKIHSYKLFDNEKFNRFSISHLETKPANNYGDGFLDFTEINNDIKTYLKQQGVDESTIENEKFIRLDYKNARNTNVYEPQSFKKYYEHFAINKSTTIEKYNNNIQIEYDQYIINFPIRKSLLKHGIEKHNKTVIPFDNTPDIRPYTGGQDDKGSFPYVHVRFFIRKKP